MRLTLFALATLALVPACAPARAADPAFDELLAKLADARKAKDDAAKAVAELEAALRKLYADYHEKLVKAGVIAPGPPPPPPPPPPPADPLKAKVRAALEKDQPSRDAVLHLAELYRQAAKLAGDRAAVASTAELLRQVREAATLLLKDFAPETLAATRKLVQEELAKSLGKSDESPIADEERKAAAELFARLAEILETFQEK